jgi:hypothetical protein
LFRGGLYTHHISTLSVICQDKKTTKKGPLELMSKVPLEKKPKKKAPSKHLFRGGLYILTTSPVKNVYKSREHIG